jgi:phosphatidylglycerophosphatase A
MNAAASPRPPIRTVFASPVHLLAFGFGAGLAPFAPGTFGTLVGVPFWWLLAASGAAVYFCATVAAFLLGCAICGASARRLGVHDHGGIVFDEVVGYLIAAAPLLGMPARPARFVGIELAVTFLLFRVFDIWKPWPIRVLDRRVQGGLGIMLDDAVAGLFAAAVLAMLWRGGILPGG